ncbi:MAG: hypothetical protein R6W68_10095 [Ignavibacteriaceae bacterium]
MKASFVVFCLTSILFFNTFTFAQGEAAVPFLLLQPSPSLSAMGQTGTALPTDDPFGFIWNPAQLGYTSQHNNLSFIFYPSKLEWLPTFNLGLEIKGSAFNAGYNFKDLINFPLSVGLGYSYTELNFGEYLRTSGSGASLSGSFYSKDYYHAYSLGLGIDYFVQLNAGITFKHITSILSDPPTQPEIGEGKAEPSVIDFGLIINVPLLNLVYKNLRLELKNDLNLIPEFNFSLGYSKSNIGDEVSYVVPDQADPLPRLDRIGYGISTGIDLISDNFQLNTFNFALTVEADDILIRKDASGWFYQSTLSDLRFWKNLINIESTNNIVSHIGLKFDFFETLTLYKGHFSGRNIDERKTNGYEIKASGLFKLWALWANDPITDFLSNHFDLKYYNTTFFADHYFETKMTGLAFYIKNIHRLF